jgi:hypothetical protein
VVFKVHKVLKVFKVYKVLKVQQAKLDHRVDKALKVLQDLMVFKDHKV